MARRRITSAAVALLVTVVVGVAAATLGRTRTSGGETGLGDGSSGFPQPRDGSIVREVGPAPDLLWLLSVLLVVAVVVLLVGLVLFPRYALRQILVGTGVAAAIVGASWLLLQFLDEKPVTEGSGGNPESGMGDGSAPGLGDATGPVGDAVLDPGVLGVLLVGLLGLGVLGVLLHESRTTDDPDSAGTDGAALSAIGRSAGRAADRIAQTDTPLDNEVYRAWKEMTDHLDIEAPVTRTPEEFRATARSAGMAAPDVDVLTDLFRDVRYGGRRPTDEREAAATDALRRIEERYADEAGSPGQVGVSDEAGSSGQEGVSTEAGSPDQEGFQ